MQYVLELGTLVLQIKLRDKHGNLDTLTKIYNSAPYKSHYKSLILNY